MLHEQQTFEIEKCYLSFNAAIINMPMHRHNNTNAPLNNMFRVCHLCHFSNGCFIFQHGDFVELKKKERKIKTSIHFIP